MSTEWQVVRLGDHVDACLGKMLDAKKNKGVPQPYLGNSNVRWGHFDLHDLAEMRFEPHEEERYSLSSGDLLVCEGGEPGRCAIWTGPTGMKAQKALHRIRPKKSLDNYYLFYWFQLAAKTELLEPYFTGTTIKHLTGKAIAALEVPLPPIGVQRAMVDVLKQLDDRITLLRETNATLEAIAQALFKSWFVDFDPVRAKLEGRAPEGMDEATARLFPNQFESSAHKAVPLGWALVKLGDVATNASVTYDFKRTNEVVFINTGDVLEGDFLHAKRSALLGLPGQAKKSICEDDILFSEIRPENKRYAYVDFNAEDYLVSTKFMIIRTSSAILPRLLYRILTLDETLKEFQVQAVSRSGTFPQITFSSISNLEITLPSMEIQQAFQRIVADIDVRIKLNKAHAKTYGALRDTLLPRLISGQLRLPEAQAAAEDALA